MNCKRVVFAVSVVFLILAITVEAGAVNARRIDICRQKELLDSRDLKIIDEFVADVIDELVETKDFTTIARIRTVALSRKSSNVDSAKAQYAAQFSESAHKYISEALKAAERLTSAEQRFRIILNLLILADSLQDVQLAGLSMDRLDDENEAIRYWAVHSVTNPVIIEQLNAGGYSGKELAERITEQLKRLVESASPEVLALTAEFAAAVDISQGEELLLQIADMRIKRYENWTVKYELLDATILKLLDSKIPPESVNKSAVARRFAQLYSYAIQRYVKGRDILSDTQKQYLASVLVETEMFCIGKRLRVAQSVVKTAVEQDDYEALLEEHNRLLGDETRAGQLPLKFNFDYGKKPSGGKRTAPLSLPGPPERPVIDS